MSHRFVSKQVKRKKILIVTKYLQNYTLFAPLIHNKPSLNLGLIIVIPCYDEDYLLISLMSLKKCEMPLCDVEVIVVINESEVEKEEVSEKNEVTYKQAVKWVELNNTPRLKFYILYKSDLPKKHAGVGLARKIGMDEACWRFQKIRNQRGVIACFDADSRCDANYLVAITEHFRKKTKVQAASIYFEHPTQGIDFEDDVYEAIVLYELHLRYFINAQKWAGFPFATQTIGSSLAVRCQSYQEQGGMNKRKAGEDFYFIHKFTPLGKFSEILNTRVIPSPRPSHRVPFGTGKAVKETINKNGGYLTYHPRSFEALKSFVELVPSLFSCEQKDLRLKLSNLPVGVSAFLESIQWETKVIEIQSNTTNLKTFQNRFFKWFNAFQVMKFLHYLRDNYYENVEVCEAAHWLLKELKIEIELEEMPKYLLNLFREIDKGKR